LNYAYLHCPGGHIDLWMIFFGNVKSFRETNLVR
jgi:hypothetical protein